jgi:tetratricopeptide (TPR) repeat protein
MPPPPPSALLAHCMPKYMVFRDRRSENFVQRKVYSEKIEATFHDANSYRRHVAIYGLPGMGKSQLMFHYVREHHTKYHAVFAADASKLESVGLSFNEFFDELKLPKCYDDDQSHRVNAVLQWMRKNTQWLLIFDNLQQKDYNRLKKSYFPQGDFGHIMVTTRSEWAGKTFGSGAGNLALHVEELEHGTAVKLLLKSAQLESQSQDPKLQELASELVTQLWHLPLTIEFVGKGHTSQEQLVQLLKVLKNTKEREAFMAVYTQDDEPLGYDQMTPDGTTSFLTLYTLKSVSARTQDLWNVMAYLDPTWYAESLFRTVNNATTVPLGHIVSDANALSTSFGDLYTRGVISRTDGKDGYWTHDQLHQIARVALRGQFGKEKEYATIAASWISTAFPNYNEFQRKWIHNREYLKHALTCIGFCEELQIRTPDLQRLYYKSSNYARFIGDYPTAESLGRKAIQLFDASVGDRRDYFKARDSLALALRRVNKFDEAKEILRESLKQQEQELEKDDPDTLSTLNELGWATYLAGDAEAAEPILRDAKERRERRLGEKAGVTQHTYQNLAACLTKLGKYEEAEGLYQRAFEGHKELFGTEDQHWVQHIKSNIARLYEAESRLNEAMDYFRGVKEWREKNVNFGPDHPDTLRVCVSLARVYHKLGRRDDAIQLAMKTRDKYVKVFGDDHPETKELKELIEEMSDRDRADVTIFQIPPSHP